MNKIFKYSMMLIFSAVALVLGSCTEEFEYTGATIDGEQVYFSNTLSSNINLSPNANEVKIPVNRIQRSGELKVDLEVSTSENCAVSVPNSVNFADGDSVAYLTITYDPSTMEMGRYDEVKLSIANADYTTPYGNSSYTFNIGLSEWETLGTGLYHDVTFANFYGLEAMTYNVTIEKNINTDGMYRIVSPYGPNTSFYTTYVGTGVMGWANKTNTSIVINATDPDYVYVSGDYYPGTDDGMASSGYGVMHLFSIVDYEIAKGSSLESLKASNPELFGTLKDGIISLPQMSVYVNFDDSMEPLGYVDTQGWAIALPGSAFTDYSSSFTYTGKFTDVAGNNYADGNITLGADVDNAKYIVAMDGDDVQAIIDGIVDGSVEATSITESGSVRVPITESGKYTMIIVTFDDKGTMKGSSATTFEVSLDSSASNWQPVYTGTFTHNVEPAFITYSDESYVGNPIIGQITEQYSTTMYQDQNNPTKYKIEPWIADGQSLTFEMNADGKITFKDVNTGFSHQQYGTLYAGDAAVLFDQPEAISSYYDEKSNTFVFGTVYYIYQNNAYGWLGGAYETFTVGQAQGVRPFKGHKMLSPKMFKTYSKLNIKKSVRKTAVQKPTLKRAKFVKK